MRFNGKYVRVTAGLLLATALAVGCGDDSGDDDSGDGGTDSGMDASADGGIDAGRSDGGLDGSVTVLPDGAVQLTEAQILGVATSANAGEISAGMVAQRKGDSAAVRDFGTMMVMMHTAAQQRQGALGIQAASSSVSATLDTMNAATLENLNAASPGPMFDLTYLDAQIAAHTSVRNLIDSALLPSATTAALRDELTRTRGEVVSHLAMAQALVSALRDAGVPLDAGPDASRSDAGL